MKPYYEEPGITIYHGRCEDVLPTLPMVDLVLTDPPYGIGMAANPVRQKHERKQWDASPPDAALFALLMERSRYQIIWGGNYFGLPASQGFLVWDKEQPEGLTLAMCEQAWTNIQKPAKMFRRRVVGYEKDHPTQKPVDLMTWCIRQLASEPRSVADPFMGSGTTLVACKRLGIRCVGVEIDERYCEVAVRRLNEAAMPLLEDVEPRQEMLLEWNAAIDRCDEEIAALDSLPEDIPATAVDLAMARNDWEHEKRLIRGER